VKVEGRLIGHVSLHIKSKMEILTDVLNDVNNPIEFMCQALKIDDVNRDNLDMELTDMLSDGRQSAHRLSQMVTRSGGCKSDFICKSEQSERVLIYVKSGSR